MKQKKTGKLNIWKWLFLLLLAINLAFVSVLGSRLLQVREPDSYKLETQEQKAIKIGSFETNKIRFPLNI